MGIPALNIVKAKQGVEHHSFTLLLLTNKT
nr:MAG TPA: hypothetical protein [Caudoviricetes sp.]